MHIYIPTIGRVGLQKTWASLPERWRKRTTFVCPAEEVSKLPGHAIAFDKGYIAEKRQFIMEVATTNKVFMLDDDLKFQQRPDDWSLGKTYTPFVSGEPVGVALDWMNEKLDEYAAAAFSSIFMNHVVKHRYEHYGKRMGQAFGIQKSVFEELNIRFDKYKYFQDFHATLCLLKAGYPNVLSTVHLYYSTPNSPGGVSLYRTADDVHEVLLRFVEEHTPFAKIVKVNAAKYPGFKKGAMISDLRCQWVKALRSSLCKE